MNWLLQVVDPANIGAFFTQVQADMQNAGVLARGRQDHLDQRAVVGRQRARDRDGLPRLAPRQRLWGMVIGAGIAVVLLIVFTGIVATLMVLPYLKLVGGLALLVIAAKLLVPEDEGDDVAAGTTPLACDPHRGDRRHRHEPGQRHRGRRRRQWPASAVWSSALPSAFR